MSVRHAVLGLLSQRPRHGYELFQAIEAVVGGQENWQIRPAQVYTTLSRLEKSGLAVEEGVEQDAGPEKRIYSITLAGQQALDEWFAGGIDREHQRDEFFVKLMLALVTAAADPYHLINNQRTHLYRELHDITSQRTRTDPTRQLAKILLLDKAIMHLEADIHWLDMTEGRLDEIQRQPLPEPEVRPRGRPRKTANAVSLLAVRSKF